MDKSQEKQKEDREKDRLKTVKFLSRYHKALTVVLVIIIFAIGYYVLAPKFQEIISQRTDLKNLTKDKQARESYLADLEKLVANYQKINKSDVENLDQILPTQKDIPGLFVQLQALAQENGFTLATVNLEEEPSITSREEKIRKININLNLVGGDYQSLKKFLEAVEYNLRLFDVDAVYFSPDSNNYSISLFTYYIFGG